MTRPLPPSLHPSAVGPNCPGIAAQNPGLAKYITAAIGFPFVLLIILVSAYFTSWNGRED